jgi:hyperosmotically inducible periplasmic protein
MHTIPKTLMAAGLIAAFAAPFAQADARAQGTDAQGNGPTAQADNQTVPGKVDDAWITTKVKSELGTTKGVDATDINVNTTDGRVTLRGNVANATERMNAEQVARSVKGVKSVDTSGLMVGGAMDNDDHANADGQGMTGDAKDAWISTKVKSKFATTSGVDATDINVDTHAGVVTLRGTVANSTEIEKARSVAMSVKGVTQVDTSGLTIKSGD